MTADQAIPVLPSRSLPRAIAFDAAGLPSRGIPRLESVESKPWGMREFAPVDEDGNLVKFGRTLEPAAASGGFACR